MTLKLTHTTATQLMCLFEKEIINDHPTDIAESLVFDILMQIFRKLRNKLERKIKDGYSLALTDIEAKAFYVYFQNRHLGEGWTYEQVMIAQQLAEIDKQYA